MKKYLFLLVLFIIISNSKIVAQTGDTTLNQLLSLNESNYLNRPLDSIISAMPSSYVQMKIYGIRGTARMLLIKYPNNLWVELHVRQFNYMNPYDLNCIWNINQMRQENLYKISIFKGNNCYRGCPDYYSPVQVE